MGCSASIMNKVNNVSSNEPWKDWSKHPVHEKYKCGAKLGAGAFSQVCAFWLPPAAPSLRVACRALLFRRRGRQRARS